jgi:dihydrolipoamide dehydrogenase
MSDANEGNLFDLVVIGAGPGGYIAAIRAAQLGLRTACVEKASALGGTCVRIGCIPSKALLEATERYEETKNGLKRFGIKTSGVEIDLPTLMKHKDTTVKALTQGVAGLFKKHGIARFEGHGKILGPGLVEVTAESSGEGSQPAEPQRIETKNILIATGSVPSFLPGIEPDWDKIGSSTEALVYPELPKHLVVIGAGVIGLELGSVWARLGAKVTVLEYMDRILPGMDLETAQMAQKSLKKQGLDFQLGVKVKAARLQGDGCVVEAEGKEPITCDRVLVAVGRRPYTENLGLENVGIAPDKRGRIEVDQHFRTSAPGIYAIGDVIPGPMLAHKAEDEGVAAVEFIATGYGHVNYDAIPGVVYTHPEIAAVGKTEEELKEAGIEYKAGKFPFLANGRAKALLQTEGQVKVLADAKTDRVLGVHIVGPRAGDLIAEAVLAIEFGASAEDIARTCHAHPTLAEVMKEAALSVDGRPLNI